MQLETRLLLTLVVLAALTLVEYLLLHAELDLSTQACLPMLYALAEKKGPFIGDKGTTHSSTISLGALVDSLLLPFWQNRAGHPAPRLATCKNVGSAVALLDGTPHFGHLALAHCME